MESIEKSVLSIMVVDDTPDSLRLLTDVLKEEGYSVRPVLSGIKALEAAKARPPDLILLDIMMPEIDGYEVCRRLKEEEATKDVPVIFISALDEAIDKVKAFGVGGLDYIPKPFQSEEVLARVETHLTIRRQQLALAEKTAALSRSNEELKIAKEEAETANRVKSAFLANVGHEVRTPLSVVMGYLELALGAEPGEDQGEYLRSANSAAEQLLETINAILDFSKMEADKTAFEKVAFDLHELLDNLALAFGSKAKSKGLRLELSKPPVQPMWLRGDPLRLRQVLTNLASNALKFTEEGRIAIGVEETGAGAAPDADVAVLRFSVRDTGIGIPQDKFKEIFEPFMQADSSTARKFGGTGLGLAICKGLVEAMGGALKVESETDAGSEFSFTLAFEKAEESETPPETERPPERRESLKSAPSKILLVDDHPLNAKVTSERLVAYGHSVTVASSGPEAIDRLSEEGFDIVFMDVEMPGMDGPEAVRRIRGGEAGDKARGAKIVALTAHSVKEIEEKCRDAGMDGFLAKPLDYVKVAEALGDPTGSAERRVSRPLAAAGLLSSVEKAHLHLLPELAENLRDLEREASEAAAGGEADTFRSVGHKIKGLGAAFHIESVAVAGCAIECDGKKGITDQAGPLLHNLSEVLARLEKEID